MLKSGVGPTRIALLTPYNGGNLGDAAIQDAFIANIRLRLPTAQFSGIALDCDSFIERHGAAAAFALCGVNRPFYGMTSSGTSNRSDEEKNRGNSRVYSRLNSASIKKAVKRIPASWWCLRTIRASWRELRHWLRGYSFLRTQDILVVSGGGQLDEEWGGPWGHPYALFKWAMLAFATRVPFVVVSVGASKAESRTSRFFLSAMLRMAQYRSFRDENSREIAASWMRRAAGDPVVPDPAFGLSVSDPPQKESIRSISGRRPIVAISPIAYAKPTKWPRQDPEVYERYLQQMSLVVAGLLKREYFLVIVCSSLGDDDGVILDLIGRLDDESKQRIAEQIHVPHITSWMDLANSLREADILVASRLHSTIIGFVAHKPTVAISFDPKVDRVMEDVGQTDYLFQIRDFRADDIIAAVDRIKLHSNTAAEQIASYRDKIRPIAALQYDALVEMAIEGHR